MVIATLGTGQDEQIIDALVGESRSSFMLHYNFPPYSVGEAGVLVRPVAGKLVMVNWHGVHFAHCYQLKRSSLIPFDWFLK